MSGCSIPPHRLALLATSPAATGEAKMGELRKGTEHTSSLSHRDGRHEYVRATIKDRRPLCPAIMAGFFHFLWKLQY